MAPATVGLDAACPDEGGRRRPAASGRRRGLVLATFAAVAVLASDLLTAPAPAHAAAAPDADIPGVPLPGPVVMGTLGGPVYDRVYSIFVPPGNVLLAAMTGEAGTDFDMYLFDSTAKSVLTFPPVGLVAESKGDLSNESISHPSREGGTFYLDLNGASDVEGQFRHCVAFVGGYLEDHLVVHLEHEPTPVGTV